MVFRDMVQCHKGSEKITRFERKVRDNRGISSAESFTNPDCGLNFAVVCLIVGEIFLSWLFL